VVTLKFGGTSVADRPAFERLCAIVAAVDGPRVVVVSALAGITDQLLALARVAESGHADEAAGILRTIRERHEQASEVITGADARRAALDSLRELWADLEALVRAVVILRAAPPACRDAIAACGELLSSTLVTAALRASGVPATWVDARQVMATDGRHERAVPLMAETTERAERVILPLLRDGRVAVMGGFVGSTLGGVTTTLGRGGSDYSASLIGAALRGTEIQIWTDTDGVLTADPRVIDGAKTVAALSFREASALAHFGAKVLHPATVAPAIDRGIPVRILNSRRPTAAGTLVTARAAERRNPLAGVACVPDVVVLDVPLPPDATRERVLAEAFSACAASGATVYASSIGDADVSITIGSGLAADRTEQAVGERGVVNRRDDLSLLVAVGDGLADGRANTGDILRALNGTPVAAIAESSRGGFVAVAVSRNDMKGATEALHSRFFEARDPKSLPSVTPFARTVRASAATEGDGVRM
jgi:aspartate kinase